MLARLVERHDAKVNDEHAIESFCNKDWSAGTISPDCPAGGIDHSNVVRLGDPVRGDEVLGQHISEDKRAVAISCRKNAPGARGCDKGVVAEVDALGRNVLKAVQPSALARHVCTGTCVKV